MTMQVMLSLMQSMQEMQKRLLDAKTGGHDEDRDEVEWVRGGNVSLPRLPEWSATTGPIDFADWINLLEPQMSDLTRTSSEWWSRFVTEARGWYDDHLRLPPLQRMSHEPQPSKDLDQAKWNRLEKRASTMLLASLPESTREELVLTTIECDVHCVQSSRNVPAWRVSGERTDPSLPRSSAGSIDIG